MTRTIDISPRKRSTGSDWGKKVADFLTWPFSFLGAILESTLKGNLKIAPLVIALGIALMANANTYWMSTGRDSMIPFPYFYERMISPSSIGGVFFTWVFWVCLSISITVTVIQAPALRSKDHKRLKRELDEYMAIEVPRNINFDNHVTMAKMTADQIRGYDMPEFINSRFLTLVGWTLELCLTLSGFADISLFSVRFLAFLCYAALLSALPELLMGMLEQELQQAKRNLLEERDKE
jgi:hypothetical protein